MANRILLLYQLVGSSLLKHCHRTLQLHQTPREKGTCNQLAVSALVIDLRRICHPWVEVFQLIMRHGLPVTQMSTVLSV